MSGNDDVDDPAESLDAKLSRGLAEFVADAQAALMIKTVSVDHFAEFLITRNGHERLAETFILILRSSACDHILMDTPAGIKVRRLMAHIWGLGLKSSHARKPRLKAIRFRQWQKIKKEAKAYGVPQAMAEEHIAKLYRKSVETMRREMSRAKKELPRKGRVK
jgi:hypothetical protein